MSVTHLIAAIAAVGNAAIVQAAPPAVQPPIVVEGTKQAAVEKTVCKLTSTGTMLKKRICMGESDWARVEANTEGTLKSLRDWQRVRCNFGMRC